MARSIGFANAEKKDSQDFIGKGGYSAVFDKDEIKPGQVVDRKGNILGTHRGIIHYTIGQRKGLGIASGRPLYIIQIDAKGNRIVVGEKKELFSRELVAKDVNLIAINCLVRPVKVTAKIRYRHKDARAVISPAEGNRVRVVFDEPQSAITPGQAVVFYQHDTVIGGGTIV
jgi:tRNA-specific 2-thiouridylase